MPGLVIRRIGTALTIALGCVQATLAQAPPPTAEEPEHTADKGDKLICKRFIETGSLIKRYRTCKTKREWDRERENIRAPRVTSGSCLGDRGC